MKAQLTTRSKFLTLDRQPPLVRYGLAVLGGTLATLVAWHTPVLGERAVFLAFAFTILLATLWLGLRPGLLSFVISIAVVNVLFLSADWRSDPADILVLNAAVYALWVVIVVILASTHAYRSLAVRVRENQADLNASSTPAYHLARPRVRAGQRKQGTDALDPHRSPGWGEDGESHGELQRQGHRRETAGDDLPAVLHYQIGVGWAWSLRLANRS